MEVEVLLDERRDEVVAVVVAVVDTQLERQPALLAGSIQQFRLQLFDEVRVIRAIKATKITDSAAEGRINR